MELKKFEAILDFPVSVNAMHLHTRKGVTLTQETRAYYNNTRSVLSELYKDDLMTGRLRIEVTFYESNKKRRDINNYTKTLFDCLEGYIYKNDDQIDETILKRGEIVETPCIKILIEEIKLNDERITIKQLKAINKKELKKQTIEKEVEKNLTKEALESLKAFQQEFEKLKK